MRDLNVAIDTNEIAVEIGLSNIPAVLTYNSINVCDVVKLFDTPQLSGMLRFE